MKDGSNGWFYAKRYGYGAGWPRSWQGWVVLVLYLSSALAAALLLAESSMIAFIAVMAALTGAFLIIAKRTTTGGWKWRMGEDREGGTW
ncbi:hypothetical protein [Sphingomicrobium arenosum]|uniref:hypothetical protein n=1 Tax=Sphingomicrobium arenosum TaxID=2233861 RepID=UPI002240F8F0|nr:hypothetical protein [Sphingomicrobium arenosum]